MTDRITRTYSSPSTKFSLEADFLSAGSGGSWVRCYLRANNGPSGNSSSYFGGFGRQVGYVNSNEFARVEANPFLPSGYAQNAQRWRSGPHDVWVPHTGAVTVNLTMWVQYGSIDEWAGGSISLAAVTTKPAKPGTPTATDVTPTGMKLSWSLGSNGGAAIDHVILRRSLTSNFASYVDYNISGAATSKVVTDLTANTTYYWRVYAHNSVGYSDPSDTRTQATLPSTAPGLTVVPTVSGNGASITLTPPGGATGVTEYHVEYRLAGTTTPVYTVDGPASPLSVGGLTPGATYEWRTQADFGSTYTSPWTSWTAVPQPNPNTSPGDYFDGSSPSPGDVTFSWAGTAGASQSIATGKTPLGWNVDTIGGSSYVQRVTGGRFGTYAARQVFTADATGAGCRLGVTTTAHSAEVEPNSRYVGSMYVRPSRAQRLRLQVQWLTSTGAHISYALGNPVEVTDTANWTRLTTVGVDMVAPATAAYASIRVMDVTGTGWVSWKAGEWLDADAAMVTLSSLYDYFDGATADTTEFDYGWMGTANNSASIRRTRQQSATDPLVDPFCEAPPAPPLPPEIPSDCIQDVGTWRRYAAQIPASAVHQWAATVPIVTLQTGGFPEQQVRIRFFPNPDGLAPEEIAPDGWDAELILTYIPANTEMVLDGVTQRARASVNGGAWASADHLLFGTDGRPAVWPVMNCGIPYAIAMDVPVGIGAAPPGNLNFLLSSVQRMV